MSQHFLNTGNQPTGSSAGKKKSVADYHKKLCDLFFKQEGRGRNGQAAPRSNTAPCRPQKPKCQQARKKIDPSCSVFGQRTYGGCPWGPEKEMEPLEGAQANRPWTARVPLDPPIEPQRAISQDVQEDPELLRAGSGPAPGSSEVSASLPPCVRWEISPWNCLELSTEGLDPWCPGPVQPGPNKMVILGHYPAVFSVHRLWIKVPSCLTLQWAEQLVLRNSRLLPGALHYKCVIMS